jgi:hypothetical protein
MEQSILSIIEQKINFFYKKKLVKNWPSDLMNAELAIKYAWRSDTIFDLLTTIIFKHNLCLHKILDSENIEITNEVVETTTELQRWDFYHSNLSEIEYFSTLSISKWKYDEFILSALVFCIKNKLHNVNLLKNFVYSCARYFAPVFLDENLLSSSIFSCIVELKLFDFFPVEATSGFIQYLKPFFTPEINIEGRLKAISKFLYIFSYFPVSFIKQCLLDCKKQNNLNPIILALYVLNMKFQPLQNERKFAYEQLENFKKKLVLLKLVNSEFIHKCNLSSFQEKQKKIPFNQYYSSFH